MNKLNSTYLAILFVSGGILSGIASLALSALLPQSFIESKTVSAFFILVLVEEAAKFLAIWLILKSYSLFEIFTLRHFATCSLATGFGFGLFELFLILLSSTSLSLEMVRPLLVHLATALLYGFGFYLFLKTRTFFVAIIALILSIALHLWYNAVVIARLF
ncbi:MAG: hypothetical protein U9M90_02440 [Patescibacteria group bacterium]|nr:hypothetical protein [Patescibacteria group bacterium]